MAHFAKVENGIVVDVIVADQEFIDSGLAGDPNQWIQTSYNTHGGIHYGSDGLPDGGVALRANFAGIGYTYDSENDVFYGPKPHPDATITGPGWLWSQIPVVIFADEGSLPDINVVPISSNTSNNVIGE